MIPLLKDPASIAVFLASAFLIAGWIFMAVRVWEGV